MSSNKEWEEFQPPYDIWWHATERAKKLDKPNRDIELHILIQLCNILEKINIKHWVDYGTLLGLYRDKRLLAHDNDIDVSFIKEDNISYRDIALQLTDSFYICNTHDEKITIFPKNCDDFLYTHIDLYHMAEDKFNKTITLKHTPLKGRLTYRNYFINNLSSINVLDTKLPCPSLTEKYLKLNYGEEYNKPVKHFHAGDKGRGIFEENHIQNKVTVFMLGIFKTEFEIIDLIKKCKRFFDIIKIYLPTDKELEALNIESLTYTSRKNIIDNIFNKKDIINCNLKDINDNYFIKENIEAYIVNPYCKNTLPNISKSYYHNIV